MEKHISAVSVHTQLRILIFSFHMKKNWPVPQKLRLIYEILKNQTTGGIEEIDVGNTLKILFTHCN